MFHLWVSIELAHFCEQEGLCRFRRHFANEHPHDPMCSQRNHVHLVNGLQRSVPRRLCKLETLWNCDSTPLLHLGEGKTRHQGWHVKSDHCNLRTLRSQKYTNSNVSFCFFLHFCRQKSMFKSDEHPNLICKLYNFSVIGSLHSVDVQCFHL